MNDPMPNSSVPKLPSGPASGVSPGVAPMAVRGYAAAAQMLGLGERTIWGLAKRNAIPHHRCGAAVLFVPAELRAWLDADCPTEPGSAVKVRAEMRKGAR